MSYTLILLLFQLVSLDFFFQAEDGIRDAQESRGLGDVYKRQSVYIILLPPNQGSSIKLSLIHI